MPESCYNCPYIDGFFNTAKARERAFNQCKAGQELLARLDHYDYQGEGLTEEGFVIVVGGMMQCWHNIMEEAQKIKAG